MAYQVDRFNGTFLVSVEDGTIDTSTDIRLVGKNYAGYGEIQNENFLHMLENFAGSTAPPKALNGQIWFDSTSKKLKFYDGVRWKTPGAEVSAAAPAGLSKGDFWWDDANNQLYSWSGTEFILIGPENLAELNESSAVAEEVTDTNGTKHRILKLSADGKVIAVINKDAAFVLNTENQIEGFTNGIKKGITLVDSDSSGQSQNDFYFWGTASDADRLNGRLGSDYLLRDGLEFNATVKFNDPGLTVGDDEDINIHIDQQDIALIENQQGNPIRIRITTNRDLNVFSDIAIFNSDSIIPGANLSYSLGTSERRWSNVFSSTFTGNLSGNVTGNVTGDITGSLKAADTTVMIDAVNKVIGYEGASLVGSLRGNVIGNIQGASSNSAKLDNNSASIAVPTIDNKTSVPVRDANGKIYAVEFVGISTKADRLAINDSAVDTDPTYRSAKTTATPDTIAARDSSGNLSATLFQGTATAARYADLAEKYLADKEYDTGTVVMVGGDAEVTACISGTRAIGAVSANPAYMMNSDLEGGTYIALKGRVPVKVTGPIKKGMRLRAGPDGTAVRAGLQSRTETFAIALETNEDQGVKLIEAVIL